MSQSLSSIMAASHQFLPLLLILTPKSIRCEWVYGRTVSVAFFYIKCKFALMFNYKHFLTKSALPDLSVHPCAITHRQLPHRRSRPHREIWCWTQGQKYDLLQIGLTVLLCICVEGILMRAYGRHTDAHWLQCSHHTEKRWTNTLVSVTLKVFLM